MANIKDRVGRLEVRFNVEPDRAQIERDAEEVTRRLFTSAANFDAAAAAMTLADRLAMSPAQHCAWAIRFAPEQADPKAIMALHGRI